MYYVLTVISTPMEKGTVCTRTMRSVPACPCGTHHLFDTGHERSMLVSSKGHPCLCHRKNKTKRGSGKLLGQRWFLVVQFSTVKSHLAVTNPREQFWTKNNIHWPFWSRTLNCKFLVWSLLTAWQRLLFLDRAKFEKASSFKKKKKKKKLGGACSYFFSDLSPW